MKNVFKIKVGSFARAKLQAKRRSLLAVFVAVIVFLFACAGSQPAYASPQKDTQTNPQTNIQNKDNYFEAVTGTEPDIYDNSIADDESSAVKVFPQISGIINTAVFGPDSRYVLTGHGDGAVKVWEAETGILLRSYYGHEQTVIKVAWSPDGKFIASASMDGTAKIWNAHFASDTRELYTLKHDKMVFSAAFSPDSRFVVSASEDKIVHVWDVTNGREVRTLEGHGEAVISAEYSPDGKRIASSSHDKTIIIWNADTGAKLSTLNGHTQRILSVAWSPDGRRLVSASMDNSARIWDLESGKSQTIGGGVFNGVVYTARFSPDGKQIVTSGGIIYAFDFKRAIMIWDAATAKEIRRFSDHSDTVLSAEWSSDGKRIVSGSTDTSARIYDAQTGNRISTFSSKSDIVYAAALSHDGKRLVTGSAGKKVNIWNAQTGVLERSLEHIGQVFSAAISPNGRLVAAGAVGQNNQLKIWDADAGTELYSINYSPIAAAGNVNYVLSLAFHPNGRYLAAASSDKTIIIWDLRTGRQASSLSGHAVGVSALAFNKDGTILVSGAQDLTARVWQADGEKYRLLRTFTHNHWVQSVAVSPDGSHVVCGTMDGKIYYWDVKTGKGGSWEAGNLARAVAFSADGRSFIAGVEASNTLLYWEINSEGVMFGKGAIKNLYGTVNSLRYSSGGKRVIAGIFDGTARIYNAKNFREIAGFAYFSGEDKQVSAAGRGLSVEVEKTVSTVDGEWVSITPDGFYRGSARGDRFINVLIDGNDLTRMDAYSDVFHRPNIVEARLRGLPDPADKPKLTIQQAAQFRPPAVNILSPETGSTVSGNGTVNISVSVSDRNRPIEDIRILVNGVRLGDRELAAARGTSGIVAETGRLVVRGGQKSVQFTLPVTMMERGSNRVEVMAYNGISWGYSGYSGSVNINWAPPQGVEAPLPDLWILAVGVNKYDNAMTDRMPGLSNLSYCGNDAKELVRAFKAQEGKRYKTVNSYLVTDGEIEPTAENVRNGIKFLERAGQRDVVLLFMAGHGINEDGRFYFLTKDAAIVNGKVSQNNAISEDALKAALNMPGRRLIFLDACQSGGMDINQFMYSLRRTNAYMLSSSEGDKPSYESNQYRHGLFTYNVVRGLDGMARPRSDESISVLQLSGYVRDTVMKLTEGRSFPYQQKPVQYSWGFSDYFIAQ